MRNDNLKSWDRINTVGDLIEELKKYSPDARIKTYSYNWNLRCREGGDLSFSHGIVGIETCSDNKTVSIVSESR